MPPPWEDLPVQVARVDRGPPRDAHGMSRRWTASGSVSNEEGTHTQGVSLRMAVDSPVSSE